MKNIFIKRILVFFSIPRKNLHESTSFYINTVAVAPTVTIQVQAYPTSPAGGQQVIGYPNQQPVYPGQQPQYGYASPQQGYPQGID